MMKKTLGLIGATCLVLSAAVPLAGEEPGPPPKVLQIFREEVKPGKSAAHEKFEAGWPKAFAKASWPTHYIALSSLTGPNEAWFASGYESFAAWEKDQKDLEKNAALTAEMERLSEKDGEFISSGRGLVAINRDDLGNGPHVDIATMRYFRIVTFRVRPGHDNDFTNAVKIVKDAYKKANVTISWAVYQVTAGLPSPTFMVWIPMRSLDEADAALKAMKAIQEAEGEEGQKTLSKAASEGYISVEQNYFAISSKMSYPPKEWVARDPEFWAPKPAATPAKKETKKEAAKPAEKK